MAAILPAHPIRQARQRMDLTQSQLGELVGATKGSVSAWETGRALPAPVTAFYLCRHLPGLTLEDVFVVVRPA